MNRNLSKCFLVLRNQKISISDVKFYKLINNQLFWKISFNDLSIDVIVRDDRLHNQEDSWEEEINFSIIGIQFRECWNYDIPPTYFQLIRLKRDILSKYEIV